MVAICNINLNREAVACMYFMMRIPGVVKSEKDGGFDGLEGQEVVMVRPTNVSAMSREKMPCRKTEKQRILDNLLSNQRVCFPPGRTRPPASVLSPNFLPTKTFFPLS